MAEITERIDEVLDRAQAFGGKESLNTDNLAELLVETLGLTEETAVRVDYRNPDRSIVLTDQGDIRAARKYVVGAEVVDVSRAVTRWERADA
jgi:hypothetical protein